MVSNEPMSDALIEQILVIRADGKYNMFDATGVQREAHERGFYELVVFIEECPDRYSRFILTGQRD